MVAVLSHGLAKTNLKTKTSRAKLTPRSAVYAQTLSGGRALCYRIRRAGHPGRWLLRTAKPQGGYNMEVLGVADDITDADGTDVLTYAQALEATLGKVHADPTKITIERAMQDWADAKAAAASTPDRAPAYHYAARVLAAAFPGATLQSLTARQISQWHSADTRSSRASANRSLATLKAGLTRAADLAGYKGDRPWTAVKLHSKKSSFTARVTVMTEDEEERLIEAARPDLAQLLRALQMTGARMGEIREATVGDLHGNRLALTGKTGPRVITLSADKAAWFRKGGRSWAQIYSQSRHDRPTHLINVAVERKIAAEESQTSVLPGDRLL